MPRKILILTTKNDISTNKVINWCKYLSGDDCEINRLNLDAIKINSSLTIDNKNSFRSFLSIKDVDFDFIWYRRGNFIQNYGNLESNLKPFLINQLNTEVRKYLLALLNFPEHKTLGSFNQEMSKNKIIDLNDAKEFGLNVPSTFITNSKEDLLKFMKKDKIYINKPIHENIDIDINTNLKYISKPICFVTKEDLDSLSNFFFPMLFQEYIQKKYELRVFYLNGKLYTLKINSQMNPNTIIDFRNFDIKSMPRFEKFAIDSKLGKKIKLFMQKKQYDTASLDFIKCKNNLVYFLEINPCGQFDFVSEYGYFNLENKIAKILLYGK